ncbi:MAG: hypothetical protein HY608_11690 [Planctomycetes bacterium]|nr:hypothetical protein [Planctomycetota bacterium]
MTLLGGAAILLPCVCASADEDPPEPAPPAPEEAGAIVETDTLLEAAVDAVGCTVSCRGVLSAERHENSHIHGTGHRHPALQAGPRLRGVAALRGFLPLIPVPGRTDLPSLTPFSNSEVIVTGEVVRNGDGIALRIDAIRFAERRPDLETPPIPPSQLASIRPGAHVVVVAFLWDGGSAQPCPYLLDNPEPEPWRRRDWRCVQIVEGDKPSRGVEGWYRLEGVLGRGDPNWFIAVLTEAIDEATARRLLEEHEAR